MAAIGKSIIGKIRKTNEDSIFVCNDASCGALENLYIVADGMGGHLAGEVASETAITAMREELEKTSSENLINIGETLKEAVLSANKRVYLSSVDNPQLHGMGTTVLAASVSNGVAHIVNVGDSRFYVINPTENKIEQITVDHSYVNELLLHGKITKEEAETHPNKNIITRALGIGQDIECDRFVYTINDGDILLLCSDGLTNMLTDNDILKICKSTSNLPEMLEALLESANDSGGIDNISVILYCGRY